MNFLARCSHWSRVGLLDLAINLKSWLTRVLTISQQALSVRHWSSRHCSISGRQWSGILMSPLLDGVDDTVGGLQAKFLIYTNSTLDCCAIFWSTFQYLIQPPVSQVNLSPNSGSQPASTPNSGPPSSLSTCTALHSQYSSASFESFKTYCSYSNRTVEK